jgi:crossover junction endodeoxyribonuclease RusA
MDEQGKLVTLTLPWPPSVNSYWRRNGSRYFVSAKGIQYRKEVFFIAYDVRANSIFPKDERISVSIKAYPPDKRKRDLDNILKSLLDSLQHAGVYDDDSQIDKLYIERYTPLNSQVIVTINNCGYQGISSSIIVGA